MSPFEASIPEDLKLKITGHLEPDQNSIRVSILDELTSVMPKGPNVQLRVFHGEVRAGGDIPWHVHFGPLVTVIVQGEMIFQFEDKAYSYKAGDVLIEPVGVVHRAYNPNPDVTMAAICIQLTPEGLDHILNVGHGPTDEMPMTAPRGEAFPRRGGIGKPVGS